MSTVCGTGSGNFPQPGDPDLNGSVLSAVPAFGGIDVIWTYPELNAHAVAHTIVYRSTNEDPTTRVKLRTVTGEFYYDKVDPAKQITYYYWIQIVSVNGTIGDFIGPASARARPTLEQMIEKLSGEISDGVLATSLRSKIQQIDSLNSDINSETAARYAQYEDLLIDIRAYQDQVDGVGTLLADEVKRLETSDTAQISQINVMGAKTSQNAADITKEAETRASADEALAKEYSLFKASDVQTFYRSSAPDPLIIELFENDLWVDTTEPSDGSEPAFKQHQWDGFQWVPTVANTLAGMFAAIESERLARVNRDGAVAKRVETLEASVGRKSRTFFTANPPIADNEGDMWIDTSRENKLFIWDNGAWVDGWDQRLKTAIDGVADAVKKAKAAQSAADKAQSVADKAIRTYYQAEAPTGLNGTSDIGDLWYDTDTDVAHRWTGTQWKEISDSGIAKALEAAKAAKSTADGKITTFFGTQIPDAEGIGDLWVNGNEGKRLKRWSGTSWEDIQDADIAVGVSRNQVFRQGSKPTGSNAGDLWFNSSEDDRGYRWTGTKWVPLNLYTGNQVSAAIEDFEVARVGYCMVNGSPDASVKSRIECGQVGGRWLDMHAIGEAVKGVQITDGDGERANVEQRMRSYKNELGVLSAEWTAKIQIDSNGTKVVGGFGLAGNGESGMIEAGFDVNRFWIGKQDSFGNFYGGRAPLIVEGNEVYIDDGKIRKLTIDKLYSTDKSLAFENGKLRSDLFEVRKMQSPDGRFVIDMDNKFIKIEV